VKAIIQRVSSGSVEVEKKIVGSINQGLVVLLGITHNDNNKDIDYMIQKILNLRIFGDENTDNFERSILDIQGELLIISQFTLAAITNKGNKPSFHKAAKPNKAKEIYDQFVQIFKDSSLNVQTGKFGEIMNITLTNKGPITFNFRT